MFTRNVDSSEPIGLTNSWVKVERPENAPAFTELAVNNNGLMMIDEQGGAWLKDHPMKIQGKRL